MNKCSTQELLAWRYYNDGTCLEEEQIDRRQGSEAILFEELYSMPHWIGLEESAVPMELDGVDHLERFWSDFRQISWPTSFYMYYRGSAHTELKKKIEISIRNFDNAVSALREVRSSFQVDQEVIAREYDTALFALKTCWKEEFRQQVHDLYVELEEGRADWEIVEAEPAGKCKAAYADSQTALRALAMAQKVVKALARIAVDKHKPAWDRLDQFKWEARMDVIAVREQRERAQSEAMRLSHARGRRSNGWRQGSRRRRRVISGDDVAIKSLSHICRDISVVYDKILLGSSVFHDVLPACVMSDMGSVSGRRRCRSSSYVLVLEVF